jgi:hypothetical protein
MSVQYSATVNNNRLDSIETSIGVSALLRFYSGAMPANCAAAATGTLLGTITLPSDWLAAASAGVKAKTGTWTGTFGAAGTVGYFRIYDSAGTNCHMQGTVTATGGGGDMTLDNAVAANGQAITINTFQITAGNA